MSELRGTSRFIIPSHIHTREFDGELVILDAKRGEYFSVNEVGAFVWSRVVAGATLETVAVEVAATYDVSVAMALNDLLRLGNEWLAEGLVSVETPP